MVHPTSTVLQYRTWFSLPFNVVLSKDVMEICPLEMKILQLIFVNRRLVLFINDGICGRGSMIYTWGDSALLCITVSEL